MMSKSFISESDGHDLGCRSLIHEVRPCRGQMSFDPDPREFLAKILTPENVACASLAGFIMRL